MIVFVHGVPETDHIWNRVRDAIGAPSVAVSLPGFGGARPDGFAATKDAYADWLISQLEVLVAEHGPVDLVGHDWGAGLTYRVATSRPDLLRSWAADVANIAHPDYVWHDFAQTWQTPGDGEASIEMMAALPPADASMLFVGMGVPEADALVMAEANDLEMGRCILDLYRSAVPNPHADWGPWSPVPAAGLVLHPTEDPFGDEAQARDVAAALGAGFAPIEGAGHFWPYQATAAGVAVLTDFWAGLD